MDSELREFLEGMKADLKEAVDTRVGALEKRIEENANTSLQSHEATRKQVTALGGMVKHLWRQVKGSEPPPTDGTSGGVPGESIPPDGKPFDEKLTDHDLTIAAMQGQIIAVDSKLNVVSDTMVTKEQVKSLQTDFKAAIGEVVQQNERQLKAMGLGTQKDTSKSALLRFIDLVAWTFKEPEGRRFGLTMLGAMTSLVTALGTTYALMTGRLPLPTDPSHALQVQGVPMVPAARASVPGKGEATLSTPASP